jgi:hypothetical protein
MWAFWVNDCMDTFFLPWMQFSLNFRVKSIESIVNFVYVSDIGITCMSFPRTGGDILPNVFVVLNA